MLAAAGHQAATRLAIQLAVAGGVATLVWLALLALLATLTRPRFDPAAPATLELGAEAPAVASFLTHRWKSGPEAAPATLVDLAARRHLDIDELGPGDYLLRLRRSPGDDELAPFERRVLDHVRHRAEDGVVPAGALQLGERKEASSWSGAFEKEVVAEARARDLSRARWSRPVTTVLLVVAAAPALLFAAAVVALPPAKNATRHSDARGAWVLALLFWGVLVAVWGSLRAERDTVAGRAAASRWLGVRAQIAGASSFESMGPAAVAVWDRYLAYAVAMGLAPATAAALPLGVEDPERAWSCYGGRWRLVHIRHPRLRPGWGSPPWVVVAKGVAKVAASAALAGVVLPWMYEQVVPFARDHGGLWWVPLVAAGIPSLVALGFGAGGLLSLRWGVPDLARPAEVVGEVLRRRSVSTGESRTWFVVVDDGRSDTLDAWPLPEAMVGQAAEGTVVRARVARRVGHLFSVERAGGA